MLGGKVGSEGAVARPQRARRSDLAIWWREIDRTLLFLVLTLMAIGTLVFDQSSYRNVLCLGHILAEDGRKMSKHLGNILAPMPLMDEHGADALRWFMLASGSPWQARRVGHSAIADVVRKP